MGTSSERKDRYIREILAAHPIYAPDTLIAQSAASAMKRMTEQNVFYLWHLATSKIAYRPPLGKD